ncbi:hypothetical protein D3C73_1333980 [compost metagenome]
MRGINQVLQPLFDPHIARMERNEISGGPAKPFASRRSVEKVVVLNVGPISNHTDTVCGHPEVIDNVVAETFVNHAYSVRGT